MKKAILFASASILLAGLASCGNNAETDAKKEADSINTARVDSAKKADTVAAVNNPAAEMKPDAQFATKVADIGMLEVELGKLAQQKGVNAQIKKFGATMVKDHTAAGKQLAETAQKKSIALPANLSDDAQKKINDLSGKSGADFDKAYADAMVDGHKDAIDVFKKETEKGTDPDLVAWAKKTIPTLEHHLMMAESAQKAVKK